MTDPRALAAIDVGTNSVHMVVARPVRGGPPDFLARERMPVRLGSGGSDMKRLRPDAVDRAVAALDQCRRIAEAHEADVAAVATSAVREAANAADFLRRARAEAGVSVEVVSGVEEARLIHLGALSAVPIAGRPHLVIDIGGGSTEVIVGASTEPTLARSLKLGHIRLTDRFFPGGHVEPGAVKACRRHIQAFIAPFLREMTDFEVAVGCSGTIEALALMGAARRGAPLRAVGNAALGRRDLDAVVDDILARPDPADRAKMAGLDPGRAEVIAAGAVLLRQLFKALGIQTLTVSTGALREGLLLDRFHRRDRSPASGLHHLNDLRRSSVVAVARRYDQDVAHAEHSTNLALELFDETRPVHGLGEPEREVLEASGLLHNIGRFVAHAAHHQHSYYLIRHSEQLAGFTENELELIAQVARYHRKSAPRKSHPGFAGLDRGDQRRVRLLAGLLRVGIALDRTYRRVVRRVTAADDDRGLRIEVHTAAGADARLELFTARDRCALLADALDRPVRFEVVEAGAAETASTEPQTAAATETRANAAAEPEAPALSRRAG